MSGDLLTGLKSSNQSSKNCSFVNIVRCLGFRRGRFFLNHEQRQNEETDSGLLRCCGSVSAIRQTPFSYHSQHIAGAKCTCPSSHQAQSPGADSRAGRMVQGKEAVPSPRRRMGAPQLLTQLDPQSTGAGPGSTFQTCSKSKLPSDSL